MKRSIDCLLIGYNEPDFFEYEKTIKKMGVNSGAYRDLNLNFIPYDNKPYSISEAFNLFYCSDRYARESIKPLDMGESFNAAIAYLGTYLKRRGFNFDYINSFQHGKTELSGKLTRDNILTIAITTTLYVFPLPILEIIDFIKMYNQTAKIIIGGPFISTQIRTKDSVYVEYLFNSTLNADFYVNSSQGEATLVKIIHAVKNNLPVDGIDNIYYKTASGYITRPIRKEENKLSENMVDWGLFSDGVGEFVNVRSSISCPFSCSFCGFPQHAGKYQTAEVEAVEPGEYLKGIELLKENGIVTFGDFIIGFPGETPGTVQETVSFIEKSGLDFYRTQLWYCEPITPIWKMKEKYGIYGESFEWSHHSMDSKTACDLIEDIFFSHRDPIWIPQYNFDFDTLWHLVYRGLDLDQVKRFIKGFNEGVREKIKNPSLKEVSFAVIQQLKNPDKETNHHEPREYPLPDIDISTAEFDF